MAAYYNEFDSKKAAWLRNLIAAGLIAPGEVDERSIKDVRPDDLKGFTQCHFFAGVGVWSYALRRAGWSDDRPVWTGSCPCQPFSGAGQSGNEFADERHLWPFWFPLIRECGPGVVFGEQVATKDGLTWLDLVHADLESEAYTVGAVDTCAAGFGAPHIRQRFFFVADAGRQRRQQERGGAPGDEDAHGGTGRHELEANGYHQSASGGAACGLADPSGRGSQGRSWRRRDSPRIVRGEPGARGEVGGYWADAEWLPCTDGKYRPAEPGTFPLAHGIAARVVRLRAYGDAIVAEVAREFIGAYLDELEGLAA